ncbi:MAG: hypothetical protein COA85_01890 [Robiginitomaculum sp.]|nr:MAG: hypothetical protein COA85_01890 [Robiginitomaculum sp.]
MTCVRFICVLCVLLISPMALAGPLDDAIAAERVRVSVCGDGPSIAFLGGAGAAMATTSMTSHGGITVVERSGIAELEAEICQNPAAFDISTLASAGQMVFSKFMATVAFDPTMATPSPWSIQVMNTQTGALVYQQSAMINSMDNLSEVNAQAMTELASLMTSSNYQCQNRYVLIADLDVNLRCSGSAPSADTYQSSTAYTVRIRAENIDINGAPGVHDVTGTLGLVSGTAQTNMDWSIERRMRECDVTIKTSREINYAFQPTQFPASFKVIIPQHIAGNWTVRVISGNSPRLLKGNAIMTSKIETLASGGDCSPGGSHQATTPYMHRGMSGTFAAFSASPFCAPERAVEPVMNQMPDLGLPGNTLPTCYSNQGQVRMVLQRMP